MLKEVNTKYISVLIIYSKVVENFPLGFKIWCELGVGLVCLPKEVLALRSVFEPDSAPTFPFFPPRGGKVYVNAPPTSLCGGVLAWNDLSIWVVYLYIYL